MATSLDKLENKAQIHHLHVKHYHTVKTLRKLVQYIRRSSLILRCLNVGNQQYYFVHLQLLSDLLLSIVHQFGPQFTKVT